MTLPDDHQAVVIESFEFPGNVHNPGNIGLRPISGQKFSARLLAEGNKSLVEDYPVGTRFKVQATLMKRPTGGQYLFTSWQWDVTVLGKMDAIG